MVALRNTPKGGLRAALGVALTAYFLFPGVIGSQELTALIARTRAVAERGLKGDRLVAATAEPDVVAIEPEWGRKGDRFMARSQPRPEQPQQQQAALDLPRITLEPDEPVAAPPSKTEPERPAVAMLSPPTERAPAAPAPAKV